jgi:choline dehydrogenase
MASWTYLLLCSASLVSGAVLGGSEASEKAYDYVIVGGGTAGLTVGDRLSESGKHSVLVVEYGKLGRLLALTSK